MHKLKIRIEKAILKEKSSKQNKMPNFFNLN